MQNHTVHIVSTMNSVYTVVDHVLVHSTNPEFDAYIPTGKYEALFTPLTGITAKFHSMRDGMTLTTSTVIDVVTVNTADQLVSAFN